MRQVQAGDLLVYLCATALPWTESFCDWPVQKSLTGAMDYFQRKLLLLRDELDKIGQVRKPLKNADSLTACTLSRAMRRALYDGQLLVHSLQQCPSSRTAFLRLAI